MSGKRYWKFQMETHQNCQLYFLLLSGLIFAALTEQLFSIQSPIVAQDMPFRICLVDRTSNRRIVLVAERIYESTQVERFKVWGKDRCIVLQNNRPFLMQTGSRKKIAWKLTEGYMQNPSALQGIINCLDAFIRNEKMDDNLVRIWDKY
jgi:hypothetical protein